MSNRLHWRRRCRVLQPDMFLAHVLRREDTDKLRRRRGLLDAGPSLRFFALHQAHRAGDVESELARGFDRLHRRRAGGADVVHDHHLRALFAEPFDALARAVRLLRFADQEPVDQPSFLVAGLPANAAVLHLLGGEHGDTGHDRVRAHGQSADRFRDPAVAIYLVEKYPAGETRAFGIERRGATVDVVVAGPVSYT